MPQGKQKVAALVVPVLELKCYSRPYVDIEYPKFEVIHALYLLNVITQCCEDKRSDVENPPFSPLALIKATYRPKRWPFTINQINSVKT